MSSHAADVTAYQQQLEAHRAAPTVLPISELDDMDDDLEKARQQMAMSWRLGQIAA